MKQWERIAEEREVREALGAEPGPGPSPVPGPEPGPRPATPAGGAWFDWLLAPTGAGAVEDYLEHPLCFERRPWVARIVRGLTGLVGDTKLAAVDVVIGLLEGWLQHRRPPAPPTPSPNGSAPGA